MRIGSRVDQASRCDRIWLRYCKFTTYRRMDASSISPDVYARNELYLATRHGVGSRVASKKEGLEKRLRVVRGTKMARNEEKDTTT
jgi:hypothetical protein